MITHDILLTSRHGGRPFTADMRYIPDGKPKPVVIFNHGFKGFKDWGPFRLVADAFARAGFVFVKMNFSHNGVTLANPHEFVDLEAFSKNNFSIELDDTAVLISALFNDGLNLDKACLDLERLFIVGHSRGGASAILKAAEDSRIKKVATWAAVSNLEAWHSQEELDYWQKTRVIHIQNKRTNQLMPLDFQLVENYIANRDRLNVPQAVKNLQVPMLAIHGSADDTVPVAAVHQFVQWNPAVNIRIIDGADHTFGADHPYKSPYLPNDFRKVIDETAHFFKPAD